MYEEACNTSCIIQLAQERIFLLFLLWLSIRCEEVYPAVLLSLHTEGLHSLAKSNTNPLSETLIPA